MESGGSNVDSTRFGDTREWTYLYCRRIVDYRMLTRTGDVRKNELSTSIDKF